MFVCVCTLHNISVTAWNELKRRHAAATHTQLPGYLTVEDIGMLLDRLTVRYMCMCIYMYMCICVCVYVGAAPSVLPARYEASVMCQILCYHDTHHSKVQGFDNLVPSCVCACNRCHTQIISPGSAASCTTYCTFNNTRAHNTG